MILQRNKGPHGVGATSEKASIPAAAEEQMQHTQTRECILSPTPVLQYVQTRRHDQHQFPTWAAETMTTNCKPKLHALPDTGS